MERELIRYDAHLTAYRDFRRNCRPPLVDFSLVPPTQLTMHERLENWGRASHGGKGETTAPMFRHARTPDHWAYGRETEVPTNREDAHKVAVGVYHLPEPHRVALQWQYVMRTSILSARRALACTPEALYRYVCDGRTMLINRGV